MSIIRNHGPIFLLLLVLVAVTFGRLVTTPLWNTNDVEVLCEAHELSADPGAMFGHIGFYFSQPILQLTFLAEYRLFGIDPTGYLAFNLFLHTCNAFMIYMLVHMLFPYKRLAVLAAVLFALGVGSYGKVFMSIHLVEALLMSFFHILILYCFIRNDFRREAGITSPLFLLGLGLYLMAGLTKNASFSIIGCLIAYKVFFYGIRRRNIVTIDILVFLVVGTLFHLGQSRWGQFQPALLIAAGDHFSIRSVKILFQYLVLMVFPIQNSAILADSAPWVRWIFELRYVVRSLVSLAIVSFGFFGFLFGNRAIRLFVAWTFITLLPFTGYTAKGNWLNLTHLYLASIGFCVILAAGAFGCSNLLARHRWRRYVPHLIPLVFVLISIGLTHELDQSNRRRADSPRIREAVRHLHEVCLWEDGPPGDN